MGEVAATDGEPVTRDRFFGDRLTIVQPARGHRAGTDAVLLAAAAPMSFAGLAYDAGAGVGTAGLGLALTCPSARIGLIENDPLAARLARGNIAINGMEERVAIHVCDLLSIESRREAGADAPADLVITNPPFYAAGTVRASPDPRRRAAHVAGDGGLEAWIRVCLSLLGPHGTLVAILTPEALPNLLDVLTGRAGAVTLLPVHTKAGSSAKRILVRAVRGSRAPFSIRPGLVLNDDARATDVAERIHRGEQAVGW